MNSTCRFDIKTLGTNASQDAGAVSKGTVSCNVYAVTSTVTILDIDVNDITTYGGGAFQTGLALGYLEYTFQGGIVRVGVTLYDEVKKSGRAYCRFGHPQFTTDSNNYLA